MIDCLTIANKMAIMLNKGGVAREREEWIDKLTQAYDLIPEVKKPGDPLIEEES